MIVVNIMKSYETVTWKGLIVVWEVRECSLEERTLSYSPSHMEYNNMMPEYTLFKPLFFFFWDGVLPCCPGLLYIH